MKPSPIKYKRIAAFSLALAVYASALLPSLDAATITVSRTDAGCTNLINPYSQNCQTQANFARAELVVSTQVISPGSDTYVIKATDGLNNCAQKEANDLSSPSYNYTETNSVTTSIGASLGTNGDTIVSAQLNSAVGVTDGSSVGILIPSQTVTVPGCSKKEVRVSAKKNVGKQVKASGQYFCIYEVVYAEGSPGACPWPIGSFITHAMSSGNMTSTVNVWTGGSDIAILDGSCPEPPSCECKD